MPISVSAAVASSSSASVAAKPQGGAQGAAAGTGSTSSKWDTGAGGKAADDDVDPLDAFMMGMEGELKEDLSLIGTGVKRNYGETIKGIETSRDGGDYSEREKAIKRTKGAEQHQLRQAHRKKMEAVRGHRSD
mmetsp:Transcript_84068/g.214014  ORF Transcript_84068/g.214014 Transcript_84068/m.214014 type:complete len:133 (+) Transcript_84068:64-462(+)